MPLDGLVHPNARPQFDQGKAPDSLQIESVPLVLKPSPRQQADLDQLILDQQSNYKDVAALIERISKATQRPAGPSGTAVEEPRTAQTPVLDALPVASPLQDKPLTALGQSAPALSRTAESAPSVNAEPPTLINAPPKRRRWNVGFVGALLGACIILACAGSIGVFGFGINPFLATLPAPTAVTMTSNSNRRVFMRNLPAVVRGWIWVV